jgi:predicted signal transduction protein with EAL and GGDEF domain
MMMRAAAERLVAEADGAFVARIGGDEFMILVPDDIRRENVLGGRADRRFYPRALRRLKALGIRIAMDDFGTGYSSLSYLQSFPFDKIKIDRSFISNLEATPQSATIVRAVLSLAHALHIPFVAEGVETEAQRTFLGREACEEMQGYLIGRPEPIERHFDLIGINMECRRYAKKV